MQSVQGGGNYLTSGVKLMKIVLDAAVKFNDVALQLWSYWLTLRLRYPKLNHPPDNGSDIRKYAKVIDLQIQALAA